MADITIFSDEELKLELERRGFFTNNLWCEEDVESKFETKTTKEVRQTILNNALTNEAIMSQIWFSIEEFGELEGLTLRED